MPRLPKDYSNTIIYKIVCNDVDIKECYVGHTTNFVKRKSQHKRNCNNITYEKHNLPVYQFIRENNGWDNFNMVMIEEYNAENRLQAETRERYWIETLQSKLNKKLPTQTFKEWYDKNKEEHNKKSRIYQQEHKEHLNKISQNYYETHKEELAEKAKNQYTCECGSTIRIGGKARHERTQKHINFKTD